MLPPRIRRPSPLVLVADDDRLLRQMARDVLEAAVFEVVEAQDGSEAVAFFERDRPDLVLLDVHMPGRSGFSVCSELREARPSDETPIVVVTGSDDRESIDRAYDAGATDFIAKPVNWHLLPHRVRGLIRASRARSELRRSELLLAQAQRLSKLGSWHWNAGADEMSWSDETFRILGLEPGSLAPNPRDWWGFIHPDDRDELRARGRHLVEEGGSYSVDHRIVRRDESVRYVRQRAELVRSGGDGVPWLMGTLQDVTERRRANEKIRYLANYDRLTGVANRELLVEGVGAALAEARENDRSLALLHLDIDRFKRVNDSLGRAAGDRVLCHVAELLRGQVRSSDLIARPGRSRLAVSRLGGDTFTIVLHRIDSPEVAGAVARRILQDLSEPVSVEGHEISVTGSLGISVYPGDGEDAETLVRHAELAMQHAKKEGNDFQFFRPAMNRTSARKMRVEVGLRRALDDGGLELHYQPRIDLTSGRAVGFEGLLRWTDAELGRVAPPEAIAVAKESGLIARLGEWNFETTCAQIVRWCQQGREPLPVAVNVPPAQFASGMLCETITRVLRETGVDPAWLEVELTEHAVLQDNEVVAVTLRDLKAIGISVALDDFGTGYSSLGYLTRLSVDLLKLDRTFVLDVDTSPSTAGVVGAVISMAQSLGMRVVAEGVDSDDQAAALRELGCDEMQGFLVSPALPGDEAARFLPPDGERWTLDAKG